MKKADLEKQQKYYLEQILLTVCGGKIDLESYRFNRAFIVFGFTGSGKDCLIDHFLATNTKYPFSKFVRTLTRAGRPGEAPASDGFFVQKEFFDHLKDNHKFFYHYEKFFGDEFGYNIMHLIFTISRGNILMIGGGEANLPGLVEGIHSVFTDLPVTTIFVNRPKEEIIAGIGRRGGDPDEIQKRRDHIEKNWRAKPQHHFDHFIWNSDLKEAQAEFDRIIEGTLGNPAKPQ